MKKDMFWVIMKMRQCSFEYIYHR